MRWQPYYQFKTGLDEQAWNSLSTSEQRDALKRSKPRKSKRPLAPEEEPPEITIERVTLPIRTVTKEELARLPRYQRY